MAHVFQCTFVSDNGIECQMPRHHVDSMDEWSRYHFASDEKGRTILKVSPTESEKESGSTE